MPRVGSSDVRRLWQIHREFHRLTVCLESLYKYINDQVFANPCSPSLFSEIHLVLVSAIILRIKLSIFLHSLQHIRWNHDRSLLNVIDCSVINWDSVKISCWNALSCQYYNVPSSSQSHMSLSKWAWEKLCIYHISALIRAPTFFLETFRGVICREMKKKLLLLLMFFFWLFQKYPRNIGTN